MLREKKAKEAFARYDADNSGSIDAQELGVLMRDLGFEADAIKVRTDKLSDQEKDKTLDYDAFVAEYNALRDQSRIVKNATGGDGTAPP